MDRDWPAVVERLCEGDRLAFLELNRLVTGFLAQLRAYDFREEWDDLRQEVVASVVANARAGRLRDPQAFVGYVKVITRNKFVDRLKRQLRHREKETLPWDEETARAVAAEPDAPERRALWQAVGGLPQEHRQIVEGVYRDGRTYEEVSAATGVPLGTLKRRLRESVALLRERLRDE
jgi:RNA polymerase sigma-70 factor (ECF subfamily)